MVDNAAPDSEPTPLTTDNLLLHGIVATEVATNGIAIISDSGGAKVLRVGDKIGRATLRSVHKDHMNLNYGEHWVTLTLPLVQSSIKPLIAGDKDSWKHYPAVISLRV